MTMERAPRSMKSYGVVGAISWAIWRAFPRMRDRCRGGYSCLEATPTGYSARDPLAVQATDCLPAVTGCRCPMHRRVGASLQQPRSFKMSKNCLAFASSRRPPHAPNQTDQSESDRIRPDQSNLTIFRGILAAGGHRPRAEGVLASVRPAPDSSASSATGTG